MTTPAPTVPGVVLDGPAPPTTGSQKRFLVLLVVAAGCLVTWILLPLAGALFEATILAVLLLPVHAALTPRLRGRGVLAAAVVTLGAVVCVGAPLAVVAGLALREAADRAVTVARSYDEGGVDALIEMVPPFLRPVVRTSADWFVAFHSPASAARGAGAPPVHAPPAVGVPGGEEPLDAAPQHAPAAPARGAPPDPTPPAAPPAAGPETRPGADPGGTALPPAPIVGSGAAPPPSSERASVVQLAGHAVAYVSAAAGRFTHRLLHFLLECLIAIVATFCLLAWGPPLVRWLQAMAPMPREQSDRLLGDMRDVTRGVVLATFVTASVQTLLASIGYALADVGSLPLAAAVTFVAGLVPVLGAAPVTCAIGLLQIVQDNIGWGLFLFVWGIVVINLTENILVPWICGERVHMSAGVMLFAMLGGMAVFGALGLVAGPMIVAFFRSAVEIARGVERTTTGQGMNVATL